MLMTCTGRLNSPPRVNKSEMQYEFEFASDRQSFHHHKQRQNNVLHRWSRCLPQSCSPATVLAQVLSAGSYLACSTSHWKNIFKLYIQHAWQGEKRYNFTIADPSSLALRRWCHKVCQRGRYWACRLMDLVNARPTRFRTKRHDSRLYWNSVYKLEDPS